MPSSIGVDEIPRGVEFRPTNFLNLAKFEDCRP